MGRAEQGNRTWRRASDTYVHRRGGGRERMSLPSRCVKRGKELAREGGRRAPQRDADGEGKEGSWGGDSTGPPARFPPPAWSSHPVPAGIWTDLPPGLCDWPTSASHFVLTVPVTHSTPATRASGCPRRCLGSVLSQTPCDCPLLNLQPSTQRPALRVALPEHMTKQADQVPFYCHKAIINIL